MRPETIAGLQDLVRAGFFRKNRKVFANSEENFRKVRKRAVITVINFSQIQKNFFANSEGLNYFSQNQKKCLLTFRKFRRKISQNQKTFLKLRKVIKNGRETMILLVEKCLWVVLSLDKIARHFQLTFLILHREILK